MNTPPIRRRHLNATGRSMATDHIRYDVLARDALRGVLRRVLTDAAEHGLPGDHHFFITFLSTADGVKLSPRLLAQYPEEMTDHPPASILGPHGDRGSLRSRPVVRRRSRAASGSVQLHQELLRPLGAIRPAVRDLRAPRRKAPRLICPAAAAPAPLPALNAAEPAKKPNEGAEVVRLDRFRKK